MFLTLISLLTILISGEGRGSTNRIVTRPYLLGLASKRRWSNEFHHIKLSPVPSEVEPPGSQLPSSYGGIQFEVLLAPSAPSNNFIPKPYDGPYYVDHQGALVQRPGDVKPLNFHEVPPAFPQLTDEELTMLGQPLLSHHTQIGNQQNSNSGPADDQNRVQRPRAEVSPVPSIGKNPNLVGTISASFSIGSSLKPSQNLGQQHQKPKPAHQPQPGTPANLSSTMTGQPLITSKLPANVTPLPPQSSSIKPSSGTYIATVNNGAGQPSAVFTCLQTQLLDQPVLDSGDYSPGPRGYSCKVSKGRPFLSNHLLSANNQSPVSQPTVTKNPKPLPTVIPVNFWRLY